MPIGGANRLTERVETEARFGRAEVPRPDATAAGSHVSRRWFASLARGRIRSRELKRRRMRLHGIQAMAQMEQSTRPWSM